MTEAILARTIAFLREQMQRRGKDELALVLFGGEPLIRPDLCRRILRTAKAELNLQDASLVTNGVRLGAGVAAGLVDAGLDSVQITLDGGRSSHDETRTTPHRTPTYDRILGNLLCAIDAGLNLTIRMNVTRANVDTVAAALSDLRSALGPHEAAIELAAIHDIGIGFDGVIEGHHADAERFALLYEEAHKLGFRVEPYSSRPCVFCEYDPGEHGAIINADGYLYPCWDALGRDGVAVGSVDSGFASSETCDARWSRCGDQGRGASRHARFNALVNERIVKLLIEEHAKRSDR
jgi:uncharacterized protein